MEKISAVYKIVNTVTNECYVGSSKNVMHRWSEHKCPSRWKREPNKILYQDFQKYGLENFQFQILAPVIPEYLKQVEQEFIEMIHPKYNNINANGWDVERHKEGKKKNNKKYNDQLCSFNSEILTRHALAMRFYRAGIEHYTLETRKYLLNKR